MNYSKYYKEIEEKSYDFGTTWIPTSNERQGELIGTNFKNCSTDERDDDEDPPFTDYSIEIIDEDGNMNLFTYPNGIASKLGYLGDYGLARHIKIGSKITELGFELCKNFPLETITFDGVSSLQTINPYAFFGNKFQGTLSIPKTVETIGYNAFDNCGFVTELVFEEGSVLRSIGGYNFRYGTFTKVDLPSTVQVIGDKAFERCPNLKETNVPRDIESFNTCAYADTSIDKLTIDSTTILERDLTNAVYVEDRGVGFRMESIPFFYYYTPTQYIINCEPSRLGSYCFEGGIMSEINIPTSVTEIDSKAFNACNNLTDIYYEGSKNQWNAITKGSGWDSSFPSNYVIHYGVEDNSVIEYTTTDSRIITPYKTTGYNVTIVSNTYNSGVGRLEFSGDLTTLAMSAFTNCSTLETMTLPKTVTTIGERAFRYCSNLTTINLNNVTTINSIAFGDCTSLRSVRIPSSVTTIVNNPFQGCYNIEEFIVDENSTFSTDGKSLYNGKTLISGSKWGVIRQGTLTLGTGAFNAISTVNEIYIPSSVTEIMNFALYGMGDLDVYYYGTESEWNAITKGTSWNTNTNITMHYLQYYIYCNRGYIGLENSGFDANREDLPIEGDETFKWIIEPIDESWFYLKNSTNNAYISRDVDYGIFRCREDFNDYRMKFCVNLENVLCCVFDDSTIDDRLFSFGVDGAWSVYIGTTWFEADNGSQWNFRNVNDESDFFIPTKAIPTSEIEYGQEYYKPNELWCRYVTFNEGDTITITLDLGECVDRNENILTINHYLSNMKGWGLENGFNMYYPHNGDNTQLNMAAARFNYTTSIEPNSTIEIKIVYGGKVLINGEDCGYYSSWITENTDSNFFFIGSFEGGTRSNARMTVTKTTI